MRNFYNLFSGICVILLGNVLGRVKHNYFVGIRTPWTLANEEVWRRTHRLAGPIWVAGGVIYIILSLTNSNLGSKFFFVVVMVLALVPAIYSYIAYRNVTKNK